MEYLTNLTWRSFDHIGVFVLFNVYAAQRPTLLQLPTQLSRECMLAVYFSRHRGLEIPVMRITGRSSSYRVSKRWGPNTYGDSVHKMASVRQMSHVARHAERPRCSISLSSFRPIKTTLLYRFPPAGQAVEGRISNRVCTPCFVCCVCVRVWMCACVCL
jgi:hypothetical protein